MTIGQVNETASHGGSMAVPANEVGSPPHPNAIPATGPPSYSGHYYAGVLYSGSSTTATEINVTLQVPDDHPEGSTFYYVILSVWDNAGSYDQIGFTNDYGTWGLAYSWTSSCAGSYYYSADAVTLQPGESYNFEMSVSSGYVHFAAYHAGGGTLVWSHSADTGGTNFQVAGSYSCNSESWWDYTDYEEVYDTTGPVVPYDFFFTYNWADSFGSVGTWGTFSSSAPSGVNVWVGTPGSTSSNGCPAGCPIMIANEPYYVHFTNGRDSTSVEPTTASRTFYWNVTVSELSSDSPIYLSTYHLPGGWAASFLTTQGSPTFISEFSYSFPSSTTAGSYYIGVNTYDGSGSYDRVALGVDVLPILSTSVSGSPGSGGIDVGQTTTFSANAGGGSGVYSYDWTAVPVGCSVTTSASFRCGPSSAGSISIAVTVTDSLGYTAVGTSTYIVDTDPAVEVPSATPGTVDVGQPIVYSVVASGGSGGYAYAWSGLPTGCTSSGTASDSCAPSGAGRFSVVAAVTDSNGFTVMSQTLSFTVYSDPTVSSFSTSPGSLLEGVSTTFVAAVTGGRAPLVYSYLGLPAGCSSANVSTFSCTPSATGTFIVYVIVLDANGFNVTQNTTLTVNPSFLGLPALEGFALVGGGIALAAVAATVLLLSRRKRRGPKTIGPPQQGTPPPGAS